MKKLFLVLGIVPLVLILANCSSSKKTTAKAAAPTTYQNNISTLVMSNCSPCHVPSKGGNKKPYDNYTNASADIDEIIRRIELHPGDKGFMPFKRARLSDSTIAVFKAWKAEGTPQ